MASRPSAWAVQAAGRQSWWAILDGGIEKPTGYSEGDREQAEKALAAYIENRYRAPSGPRGPDQMTCQRALEIYGNEHAPSVAAPALIGYHMDALGPFWGELSVSSIKGETCRAYVKSRKVSPATARRELETLSAAINHCHKEGYLTTVPRLTYPKKPKARERWLTRQEAAALLRAARNGYSRSYLPTFILLGLYTGTRSGAILALQWMPNTQGGWIDLDAGMLYRGPQGRIETNKRKTPCSLPEKLLRHLRHVRQRTRKHVIEYNGGGIDKLRRSFVSARKLAGLGKDVVPHVLGHTAITWRLQRGVSMWEVAGYFGKSEKVIRENYGHHHPDFQKAARDAI